MWGGADDGAADSNIFSGDVTKQLLTKVTSQSVTALSKGYLSLKCRVRVPFHGSHMSAHMTQGACVERERERERETSAAGKSFVLDGV